MLAQIDSSGNIFYDYDNQVNAPQKIANASRTLEWDFETEPFGETYATPTNTTPTNHRFPGQYADSEDTLSYNYFRDYDPSIGRYIEADPMGLNAGPNLFAYAGDNPTQNIDPSGLTTITYADGHTETYYTAAELSYAFTHAANNSIKDISFPAHATPTSQGISDSLSGAVTATDYMYVDSNGNAMMVGPSTNVHLSTVLANKMAKKNATIETGGCNAAADAPNGTNITEAVSKAVPGVSVSGSTDATYPTGFDFGYYFTNLITTGTLGTLPSTGTRAPTGQTRTYETKTTP